MKGLLYKEWLYTKRNARAVAIHVLSPLVVIAVNAVLTKQSGWARSDLAEVTVFFGFYTAISFSTVFRAVERIRAEIKDGTAPIYLLTRATPTRLAAVKFGFESAINLLAVTPLLVWLGLSRPGFISVTDVAYTSVASIALTALTFALSCLVRSDDTYRAVTLFLSMTPILPGLVLFSGQAKLVATLIPTLTAFEGFRAIAADQRIDLTLPGILLCGLAISLAVTMWAYPRQLKFAFTRPTS